MLRRVGNVLLAGVAAGGGFIIARALITMGLDAIKKATAKEEA